MPFELEIIGIKYYHVVISGLYKIDSVENSMQNFSKQGKEALFFFHFECFHLVMTLLIHLQNILLGRWGLSIKEALRGCIFCTWDLQPKKSH
jgi:hypothetical protein